MLYDRDIWLYTITDDKVVIEYIGPTEAAVFTREDLVLLLKQLDYKGKGVCKHKNLEQYAIRDIGFQLTWFYSECADCNYIERVPVCKDLSVGDIEILSGEQ